MPRFSVIIPTYNRSLLLKEAIDSVLSQSFQDYEIIVVDDGSTDNTRILIKEYGEKIHYYYQDNQGPGIARNLGINNAAGEFITFLDSDDLWFPWTLKVLNEAIYVGDNPSFVCGEAFKINESEVLKLVSAGPANFRKYNDYLNSSCDSIWIGTCAVAINTEILKHVGCFHSQRINAEDSDLWLRLGTASGFVRIESPALFGHRFTSGSEISNHAQGFAGFISILESERLGKYPGGIDRKIDRWRIISRHIRPGSLTLLREGYYRSALELYFKSFYMNNTLAHWKYIFGFWFVFLQRIVKTS